jgi:DNA-directed RNA polymerase subunit M/transcription elongation factor TFIIS
MKKIRPLVITQTEIEEWKRQSAVENNVSLQQQQKQVGVSHISCPICGKPSKIIGVAQTRGTDEGETTFMSCGEHRFRK